MSNKPGIGATFPKLTIHLVDGGVLELGNFIVTLAKICFEDATEGQTAKVRRIVSGRLVLTPPTSYCSNFSIAAQIEAATAVAAGHEPN